MKNPFTFLNRIFWKERENQKIRQRIAKDAFTKKETARSGGGSGGGSAPSKVGTIKSQPSFDYPGIETFKPRRYKKTIYTQESPYQNTTTQT